MGEAIARSVDVIDVGGMMNKRKKTKKTKKKNPIRTRWMNIYQCIGRGYVGKIFGANRAIADKMATPERVACVKVRFRDPDKNIYRNWSTM